MLNTDYWEECSREEALRIIRENGCWRGRHRPAPYIIVWYAPEPDGGNYAAVKRNEYGGLWYKRIVTDRDLLALPVRRRKHIGYVIQEAQA